MTALSQYQRLECPGVWRENAASQRRDVIVSFGDATLVIADDRSTRPLAHWSLPALERINPGQIPALYTPGPDSEEQLEIDDETMIAAISKIHAFIGKTRPRPGRLRMTVIGAMVAALVALGVFWLPGAIIGHTASVLPFAKRDEIGRIILSDMTRLTGSPCVFPEGQAAVDALTRRLFPGKPWRVVVLPEGLGSARHLPGGILLLDRRLIEQEQSPERAAGHLLAEAMRAEAADPLIDALHWAGLTATFRLLTTGDVPAAAFAGYGEALLSRSPAPVADETLLARFQSAGVPSTPYAYGLDPTGETTLGLIEADPFRAAPPPRPVLSDADWVRAQEICAE